MIYLMYPDKNFVNFTLRNFASFSSLRIARFWIGNENIPPLTFTKNRVTENVFHKGSFLRSNL